MGARINTPTCCLTLPLHIAKWQADKLDRKFEAARRLYNQFVNYELKELNKCSNTPEYRDIQKRIAENHSSEHPDKTLEKKLYQDRNRLLRNAGFSECSFTNDMTKLRDHYKHDFGSIVAQSLSNNAWRAFRTLLFGKGDRVHFKRYGELNTVSGKSQNKEIRINDEKDKISWMNLEITLKKKKLNDYELTMLNQLGEKNENVKYIRILRKWIKTKYQYYAQIVMQGIPAQKFDNDGKPRHPLGSGRVGIDIGPQTIAYVSDTQVGLEELADKVCAMEKEKRIFQRKLDRSRRAMNPNNYKPDGTIKRGIKLTHNKSNHYKRTQAQLKEIMRKQADVRSLQHHILINRLLPLGDEFYVETMNINALARRTKKTEISQKTGRYKRKRRFGKSIANKAPASLLTMLDRKLKCLGNRGLIKIETAAAKASQYDHISGEYTKKSLSKRWTELSNGDHIQRDLYSAFLIQNTDSNLQSFNQTLLEERYGYFKQLHDAHINYLRDKQTRVPSSMGISANRK